MALTPIRTQPGLPVTTPQQTAAGAARAAAQKAFFQAAMGGEEVAAARAPRPIDPVEAIRPASGFTPQSMQRASVPDEAPVRIMRPGSFIDIKV